MPATPCVGVACELIKHAEFAVKEKRADQLVEGIQYEKFNQWYEMTQFDAEIEG